MLVKRCWSPYKNTIDKNAQHLDVWDGGSQKFERWPDGTECSWKIISRELDQSGNGFTEILKQLPSWNTPSVVMNKEQIPLIIKKPGHFYLGNWSILQTVHEADIDSVVLPFQIKPQVHRAKHHYYKK